MVINGCMDGYIIRKVCVYILMCMCVLPVVKAVGKQIIQCCKDTIFQPARTVLTTFYRILCSTAVHAIECYWGSIPKKRYSKLTLLDLTRKGPILLLEYPKLIFRVWIYKVLEAIHRDLGPCWLDTVVWISFCTSFCSTFISTNVQLHFIANILFCSWDLGNEQRSLSCSF